MALLLCVFTVTTDRTEKLVSFLDLTSENTDAKFDTDYTDLKKSESTNILAI